MTCEHVIPGVDKQSDESGGRSSGARAAASAVPRAKKQRPVIVSAVVSSSHPTIPLSGAKYPNGSMSVSRVRAMRGLSPEKLMFRLHCDAGKHGTRIRIRQRDHRSPCHRLLLLSAGLSDKPLGSELHAHPGGDGAGESLEVVAGRDGGLHVRAHGPVRRPQPEDRLADLLCHRYQAVVVLE